MTGSKIQNALGSPLRNESGRQSHRPPPDGSVFVFGSNERGRHGKGAALHAARHFGAQEGVGVGLTGHSYAVPTKDRFIKTLPIPQILPYVRQLLRFADLNPQMTFAVTPIGTGLAGYPRDWIARLFAGHGNNVFFTEWDFEKRIPLIRTPHRVIVTGSKGMTDKTKVWPHLDKLKRRWEGHPPFEIVCAENSDAGSLSVAWAKTNEHPVKVLHAPWFETKAPCATVLRNGTREYNASAAVVRDAWMAAYGTHLVVLRDSGPAETKTLLSLCSSPEVALPIWMPHS